MLICPRKFKGCWYVLESLKGVDLLESLPTSPIFVFLLWNWHFFEEFVVCSVPVFSFASVSIFLPHNMYWMWARPGKFPICEVLENWWTAQTINGKNCQQNRKILHYTDWENLEKRIFVFHQKDTYILYYISEYDILLKLTETRSFHNISNWLRERSDGDFVLKYSIICLHV